MYYLKIKLDSAAKINLKMSLKMKCDLKQITDQLTLAHIMELKELKVLPPLIGDVMKSVMAVLNKPQTYVQIKIELCFPNKFIAKVKDISQNITCDQFKKMNKYTSRKLFNPLDVSR